MIFIARRSYLKDCVFNSPDVTDDVEKSIDDVMKLGKVKMVACPDHVLLMLKKWVKHQMTFVRRFIFLFLLFSNI